VGYFKSTYAVTGDAYGRLDSCQLGWGLSVTAQWARLNLCSPISQVRHSFPVTILSLVVMPSALG